MLRVLATVNNIYYWSLVDVVIDFHARLGEDMVWSRFRA